MKQIAGAFILAAVMMSPSVGAAQIACGNKFEYVLISCHRAVFRVGALIDFDPNYDTQRYLGAEQQHALKSVKGLARFFGSLVKSHRVLECRQALADTEAEMRSSRKSIMLGSFGGDDKERAFSIVSGQFRRCAEFKQQISKQMRRYGFGVVPAPRS